jgi:hypothetical protein
MGGVRWKVTYEVGPGGEGGGEVAQGVGDAWVGEVRRVVLAEGEGADVAECGECGKGGSVGALFIGLEPAQGEVELLDAGAERGEGGEGGVAPICDEDPDGAGGVGLGGEGAGEGGGLVSGAEADGVVECGSADAQEGLGDEEGGESVWARAGCVRRRCAVGEDAFEELFWQGGDGRGGHDDDLRGGKKGSALEERRMVECIYRERR